jgi:hypothetical protein
VKKRATRNFFISVFGFESGNLAEKSFGFEGFSFESCNIRMQLSDDDEVVELGVVRVRFNE